MVRDVGRSAEVLAAGITEPGAPARAIAAAQERGRIDLPINNAGNARAGHLDDLPEADIQAMITLNLTAPILLSTFTAEHLYCRAPLLPESMKSILHWPAADHDITES